MIVRLYPETPAHRSNFLKLAGEGFFDSTTFHRVIKEFMIQGGDPYSKDPDKKHLAGQGGPGYTLPAEIKKPFYHKRGVLSAARTGDRINPERRSSGSQFYIVQGKTYSENQLSQMEANIQAQQKDVPEFDRLYKFSDEQKKTYMEIGGSPWLDGAYTVFGEVIAGMEVIDKIAAQKVAPRSNRPLADISMSMTVLVMKKKKITKEYGFEYPGMTKKKSKKK